MILDVTYVVAGIPVEPSWSQEVTAGQSGSSVLVVEQPWRMTVDIDHGNGYVTRYGHNQENLVQEGDKVEKGQAIALMGSSGRSTGPHVHFEVLRNGKVVNPSKYIQAAR